ncbi:hypothetical protein FVEG_09322 [Fusarium verticillioides 7600]|uniref:Zn(2)-C6 fungal-type domain-containing protein n=1 Tax=Gibberella moniliformis (strain M3125 / FGSC 7600) TaxID=334819 RepID=W7MQH8_GIBM7|nr:hypothetical protein FVEG_09322 [Fusarium verticillioides 7600]EWG49984.1 hypothetical protein FVEG_09322 [Fusarium verticillioides 7600]
MSSPASHRDESTDLSPTVTNTSMDSEPKKAGKRVLSCVLCQQRKKKCDRKSPCSNCIRLKTVCTPSLPAPPRKRRRPNQDLLERLARCEELLRHCTCIRLPTPEHSPPNQREQSPLSLHEGDDLKRKRSREQSPTGAD